MDLYQELVYQFTQEELETNFNVEIDQLLAFYPASDYQADYLSFANYLFNHGYVNEEGYLLERLYQEAPDYRIAYELANYYYLLSDLDRAKYWVEEVQQERSTYKLSFLKSKILMDEGNYLESKKILHQLLKKYPTKMEPYYSLSQVALAQGDRDKHIYYLEILMEYFLNDINIDQIRYQLIQAYADSELVNFDKINKLLAVSESPIQDSQVLNLLGQIYFNAFAYDQAIKFCQQAVEIDLDDFESHFIILKSAHYLEDQALVNDKFTWLLSAIPPYSNERLELIILAHDLALYDSSLLEDSLDLIDLVDEYTLKKSLVEYIVNVYLSQNLGQEALEFLDKFQDPFINKIELSPVLARTYAHLNYREEACRYFDLALDHLISDPNLVYDYGVYLMEENFPDIALDLSLRYQNTFYDIEALQKLRVSLQEEKDWNH